MLNNQFLYYLLNIKRAITAVILSGSFSTQINVGMREMEKLKIMLPSVREQESIVFYLNSKCGEIDKVISTQEKRIALLQELKQSIITHAVTKGLNPDVKMKDSGIDWIGEVPEHWSSYRIKYNTFLKGRIGWQGLKASEFLDEGYCLITGTDFDNNGGVNWDSCYRISKERFFEDKLLHVKEGDILITKDGTVGKLALIKQLPEPASLNSHLLIVRQISNLVNNVFLYYCLLCSIFKEFTKYHQTGSIMNSISQDLFGYFKCFVPPLTEQQEIASYLDKRCASIDASISKAQREIELLQEYKQSLITEVVTGKRKVC